MSDAVQTQTKKDDAGNGTSKAKAEKEPRQLQTFATLGADFTGPAPDESLTDGSADGWNSGTSSVLSHEPSALLMRRISPGREEVESAGSSAVVPTFGGRNFGSVPTHASTRPAIQPKLTVGAAHDSFEQEADDVAEQVMRMPAPVSDPPGGADAPKPGGESIQRAPEEEEIQTKPLAATMQERQASVPRWQELPDYAQNDLKKWKGLLITSDDISRLTVLNLYVKLKGLNLWKFVGKPENSTGEGRLEFSCSDVAGLKNTLRSRDDFSDPEESSEKWSSREKRGTGSLHFKHFEGWGDKVQAHIDQAGLVLKGLRNLVLPVQALRHLADWACDGYQDVFSIRGILLGQGWDPAPLKGAIAVEIERALREVVQPKLADGTAEQVMRMSTIISVAPDGRADAPEMGGDSIQRTPEEDEIQTKPLAATIRPWVQRAGLTLNDEEVQRAVGEEDELQTKRTSAADSFEVGSDFENRVAGSGGGSPLPAETRAFMEPRFGADFSGVRVHSGGEAADLNRQVSARAFTLGRDIYLGEGQTDVASDGGKRLLAHELTHVVQQGGAGQVQRVTAPEENELQMKPLVERVQRETALDDVDRLAEPSTQDAVDEADEVVRTKPLAQRMDEAVIQRAPEEEEIQTNPLAATIRPFVQRITPTSEDEEVQRAAGGTKAPARVRASLVTLRFIPDEKTGPDGDPMGVIHVFIKKKEVAQFDARGGPPVDGPPEDRRDPNNPKHVISPSPPGKFTLGGEQDVLSDKDKWIYSQLAWGTPIRDDGSKVEFAQRTKQGIKWISTTAIGLSRKDIAKAELRKAIDMRTQSGIVNRGDITKIDRDGLKFVIHVKSKPDIVVVIPKQWDLNDFGKIGFRVGRKHAYIHATPETEDQFTAGFPETLEFSLGCIHIKPSDREKMIDRGYLQRGVKITIKEYKSTTFDQWRLTH